MANLSLHCFQIQAQFCLYKKAVFMDFTPTDWRSKLKPRQLPTIQAPFVPSASSFQLLHQELMALTKLLVTDLASSVDRLPSNYIRPVSERPNLLSVEVADGSSIPLIDLQGPNHSETIKHLRDACRIHGFFQVKNHGVPERVINNMLRVAKEFFQLPESERLKMYSSDTSKSVRLSTSFNVNTEKTANWRDFLRLHCHPLEEFVNEWPSNPPSFREEVSEYCTETRKLVLRLLEAISESLGLEKEFINKALGNHGQHMALNYYPPCPQPELTYGLPGHTDPNLITILLQDDVPGLQVLRDGKWVAVNPIPNTFIVNIGDQMQAISNDQYKSVLHRAVVNCDKVRMSIPTFYCPSSDALVGPAPGLINKEHPAVYKNFTYAEYFKKFWQKDDLKIDNITLDLFKISSSSA